MIAMHTLSWAKGTNPALASIYCVHCRQVFRWRIEAQWARELVGRYNTQHDRLAVEGER